MILTTRILRLFCALITPTELVSSVVNIFETRNFSVNSGNIKPENFVSDLVAPSGTNIFERREKDGSVTHIKGREKSGFDCPIDEFGDGHRPMCPDVNHVYKL